MVILRDKNYFESPKIFAIGKLYLGKKGNTMLILECEKDWFELGELGCCNLHKPVLIIKRLQPLTIGMTLRYSMSLLGEWESEQTCMAQFKKVKNSAIFWLGGVWGWEL